MVIPGLLQAQKHWLEATTSFINNCHRQTSAIVFVGVHRGMNDTEFYWYFPPHRQRLLSHPTPLLSHFQQHLVKPLPSIGGEGGSARAWDFSPPLPPGPAALDYPGKTAPPHAVGPCVVRSKSSMQRQQQLWQNDGEWDGQICSKLTLWSRHKKGSK